MPEGQCQLALGIRCEPARAVRRSTEAVHPPPATALASVWNVGRDEAIIWRLSGSVPPRSRPGPALFVENAVPWPSFPGAGAPPDSLGEADIVDPQLLAADGELAESRGLIDHVTDELDLAPVDPEPARLKTLTFTPPIVVPWIREKLSKLTN